MPVECYRLKIQGISTGEQTQNVLHFNVDNNDDALPATLAQELVNTWTSDVKNAWLLFNSNRYGLRYIEAKRVLPGGGNSIWKEFPEGAQVGAINAEQGPLQLAPIVKLYAGLAEGVQGRIFLPPPPETMVVNNVIDSDYRSDVIDCVESMFALSSGDHEFGLAVFSKKNGAAYGVTTANMSDILGMIEARRKPL